MYNMGITTTDTTTKRLATPYEFVNVDFMKWRDFVNPGSSTDVEPKSFFKDATIQQHFNDNTYTSPTLTSDFDFSTITTLKSFLDIWPVNLGDITSSTTTTDLSSHAYLVRGGLNNADVLKKLSEGDKLSELNIELKITETQTIELNFTPITAGNYIDKKKDLILVVPGWKDDWDTTTKKNPGAFFLEFTNAKYEVGQTEFQKNMEILLWVWIIFTLLNLIVSQASWIENILGPNNKFMLVCFLSLIQIFSAVSISGLIQGIKLFSSTTTNIWVFSLLSFFVAYFFLAAFNVIYNQVAKQSTPDP